MYQIVIVLISWKLWNMQEPAYTTLLYLTLKSDAMTYK